MRGEPVKPAPIITIPNVPETKVVVAPGGWVLYRGCRMSAGHNKCWDEFTVRGRDWT